MRIIKNLIVVGIVLVLNACNGSFEGTVEKAYPDGTIKLISYYAKDEPNVLVRQQIFYPNKQLRIDGFFKDGEKDGKWVYYYEDGIMWSKGFFRKGNMDGKYETYHPNGKLAVKGSFKEGTRIGKWYYYNEDGSLEKEVDYNKQ
jgi:antitoxin component YwqK of YwqJK toxin-antitoxin module